MQSQAWNYSGSKKVRNMQSMKVAMKKVISFKVGYDKNYYSEIINLQITNVFWWVNMFFISYVQFCIIQWYDLFSDSLSSYKHQEKVQKVSSNAGFLNKAAIQSVLQN